MNRIVIKVLIWSQYILLSILIISHIIQGYEWQWFLILYIPSLGLMLMTEETKGNL